MTTNVPVFERYELLDTLGEGGFATVYRARDRRLGRVVALKVLLPWLARDAAICHRFEAEAQALALLRQVNIVTVYDVGEENGLPFFTMELVEGQTLAQLAAGGPLALDAVRDALAGLCPALDYMHAAGIVHRDLKPSNVMIDRNGRVVLMDFGIARSLEVTQHTQTGAMLGTPQFMAPEQIRGERVGPAADIYALGVLVYTLLAGRRPFEGDTARVLYAQANEPPPPLRELRPGLPQPVYAAVEAALAKTPESRPRSASAFVPAFLAVERPAELAPTVVRSPVSGPAYRPFAAQAHDAVALRTPPALTQPQRVSADLARTIAESARSASVVPRPADLPAQAHLAVKRPSLFDRLVPRRVSVSSVLIMYGVLLFIVSIYFTYYYLDWYGGLYSSRLERILEIESLVMLGGWLVGAILQAIIGAISRRNGALLAGISLCLLLFATVTAYTLVRYFLYQRAIYLGPMVISIVALAIGAGARHRQA